MAGNGWILCVCVMLPFAGGLVSYIVGRKNKALREYTADAAAVLEFLLFLGLFLGFGKTGRTAFVWEGFGGMGMRLVLDGFQALYGLIASFMWLMTTVFSGEYLEHYHNRNRYYLFVLFTLGATVGVFLSADLFTTFLFFEIMSLTSYVWVAQDETKEALRAAGTYLAIAILGGLVMLMGLFLLYDTLGTLEIEALGAAAAACASSGRLWAAGLCLLFGFGAKAGAFPLHIWLPKAHPVAPAPASALLSGILTKAGIFGVIVVSVRIFQYDGAWGSLILTLGVITMVLGAVLALYSVNIKRTLACSSLSQIGFILVGLGMTGLLGEENALAARGSLLHMVNHSLLKLTLFLAAGVIYQNLHKLELNEIRGFGRNKPLLHLIFLTGAFGISGVPLFNGYVSKTLLHESIVTYRELLAEGSRTPVLYSGAAVHGIEWIFLISGALTAAYMAKLYFCVFVEKNADEKKQAEYDGLRSVYMGKRGVFALLGSALALIVLGIVPGLAADPLADLGQGFFALDKGAEPVAYFSLTNLKGAAISLFLGAAVYLLIVRGYLMRRTADGNKEYCNRLSDKLDLEELLYRPLLLKILPFIGGVVCRLGDCLIDRIVVLLRKTVYADSPLPHELTEGTPVTHIAGAFLDHIAYVWKRLRALGREEKPGYERRFEHKLASLHSAVSEYNSLISRSMSFGLFLFCVGFLLTMLYLLFYFHVIAL